MFWCRRPARWAHGTRPPSFLSPTGTAIWRSICRARSTPFARTLPHLRKAGGGAIVAISSIAAQMCQPRNVQGAAAKAGLEALVRVVAREEGRRGIRANAVAVGLTDTEMGRVAFAEWGPETTERVIRGIPLRRIGTPEEVARVVCFLAGPDGAYITGKVLQVDGGQIIAA